MTFWWSRWRCGHSAGQIRVYKESVDLGHTVGSLLFRIQKNRDGFTNSEEEDEEDGRQVRRHEERKDGRQGEWVDGRCARAKEVGRLPGVSGCLLSSTLSAACAAYLAAHLAAQAAEFTRSVVEDSTMKSRSNQVFRQSESGRGYDQSFLPYPSIRSTGTNCRRCDCAVDAIATFRLGSEPKHEISTALVGGSICGPLVDSRLPNRICPIAL